MVGLASLFETVIEGGVESHGVSFAAGLDGSGTVVGSCGDIFAFMGGLNIHILFVEVELGFEVEEAEHGTLSN